MAGGKRSAKEIEMAFYEHVFLTRPDLTEAQVKTMTDGFSKIITDNKGKVTKDEYWGLRTLAYKIKKNKKAHYILFNIDAPHPAVAEMERNQRLDDNILRFMTIRMEELEEGPSVMLRARSSDDRDDRRGRRKFDDRKPTDSKDTKEEKSEDKKPAHKEPAHKEDDKTADKKGDE